jgi:hypothetical protein
VQGHVAGLLWPECSILLALLGSWARSGGWLLGGIREITGGRVKREDHCSLRLVQTSSHQAAWSTRRRSKSNLALPYMLRLSSLSRVI